MKKLTITGGIPLSGEVTISGSKNAAVGILPAVLLVDAPVTIENVPNVADIRIILEIMRSLGATCEQNGDVVKIDPTGVKTFIADNDRINRLRGSYYFIGALVNSFGLYGSFGSFITYTASGFSAFAKYCFYAIVTAGIYKIAKK